MKKIFIYTLIGICAVAASSCKNTLDTHPSDAFNEETVWASYSTANAYVNAAYASVLNLYSGSGTNADWEGRTELGCRGSQVGEGIDNWATETSLTKETDLGANQASRLRMCNIIITKAAESESMSDDEKVKLDAEGHFLRALVFFYQAQRMGRFLPITQVYTQDDTDAANNLKMCTIEEGYKLIISDFETAVAGLPTSASSGRATKYAAEVLMSKACLQAYAYTGDTSYLDKCISVTQDVIANKSLSSDYRGIFNDEDPNSSEILLGRYYLAETVNMSSFHEVQLIVPNLDVKSLTNSGSNVWVSSHGNPFNGWAIFWPTQNLVDQYLAIDETTGEALPWWETSQWKNNVDDLDPSTVTEAGQVDQYERASGASPTGGGLRRIPSPNDFVNTNSAYPMNQRYAALKAKNDGRDISDLMYADRDKRFYASILYDKCSFIGEKLEFQLSGNCSKGVRDREDGGWYTTVTNYMWRKGVTENEDYFYWSIKIDYHYVIARVGEAYLNLAEAYLCKGDYQNAVTAFNNTRTIHGGLPAAKATTLEQAWKDYMRERNVEMVMENADTYFSQLRWGKYGGVCNEGRASGDVIASLDKPVYQVQISRDRSKMLINQVTLLNSAQRTFTTRRYLFPIAQSFLDTRESYGLDHEQNPGW